MQLPAGWLHGATLGLDYKHVFAVTQTVTLGNAALARSVTLDASQDIDLFTVRLAVPLEAWRKARRDMKQDGRPAPGSNSLACMVASER